MKIQVTNYTFNKTAKQITFTDYTTIALESVLLVTNVTDNIIIYNFVDPLKGGTVATNVLTLTYDTSAMDNADDLQIFYDDPAKTGATDEVLQDSNSTLYWLKMLFRLLTPLSVRTGSGSNRLSVDLNSGTVTTVTTVTTLANQTNMGGITAYPIAAAQQNLVARIGNINNVVVT